MKYDQYRRRSQAIRERLDHLNGFGKGMKRDSSPEADAERAGLKAEQAIVAMHLVRITRNHYDLSHPGATPQCPLCAELEE
jgi:hypothetical protein